ncbi:MAG: DUF229 domain-containing protein [Planctomycetota bacterium]|nr:MAG: DUF229 domain-containing protein [Planctomycetota bacterium]
MRAIFIAFVVWTIGLGSVLFAADRPNILLITADDLNCDSVGAFGCPIPDVTPNIDRLAARGMRLKSAHVTIAVCQPSRNAMLSGLYPHHSGVEGFYHFPQPGIRTLPQILKENGYLIGILGKVPHCTPYPDFEWDVPTDPPLPTGTGRNPKLYAQHTRAFIERAKHEGRPFFMMANSHDPHRPFYGNDPYKYGTEDGPQVPSRVFKPEEVVVPKFLPDIPEVRREVAEYFSSVRRCDDTVGALLDVLDASGLADNTIVVFLSDHGMAFPFSKTNVYFQSTHTPLIVCWPGVVPPGTVDEDHRVAGIDLMPTLLDMVGLEPPADIDGRSFRPLLEGKPFEGREYVFTQFHETAGRKRYPMRAVQDGDFLYIFNPWSDGERIFRNESQAGRSMKAMLEAAKTDPDIDARCKLFLHRVPEELYDLRSDPDGLHNLIDDPTYAPVLKRLRNQLDNWMERTSDPALVVFRNRGNEEIRRQFMAEQDAIGESHRRAKQPKSQPNRQKQKKASRPAADKQTR